MLKLPLIYWLISSGGFGCHPEVLSSVSKKETIELGSCLLKPTSQFCKVLLNSTGSNFLVAYLSRRKFKKMPRVDNCAATDSARLISEPLASRLTFEQGFEQDVNKHEFGGKDFQTASLLEVSQQTTSMSAKSSALPTCWSERKQFSTRILSILLCVIVASVIALVFAFLYLILKEVKTERLIKEDGTEVTILGFWSLLILSSMAGICCCSFSWTLTYFDAYDPNTFSPALSSSPLRQITGNMGYGVAVLNGIVAALAVLWCLTWSPCPPPSSPFQRLPRLHTLRLRDSIGLYLAFNDQRRALRNVLTVDQQHHRSAFLKKRIAHCF